jgi:outer membrane protein TolC
VGVLEGEGVTAEDLAAVKADRDRLRIELETVTADRDRFSRGLARLAGLYLSAGKEIPPAEQEEMAAALVRWALEVPAPEGPSTEPRRKSGRRRRP